MTKYYVKFPKYIENNIWAVGVIELIFESVQFDLWIELNTRSKFHISKRLRILVFIS